MVKFGPSGNSEEFFSAGNKKSEQSALWVKNLNLDCFEYSFGRGVNMSDAKAIELGKVFSDCGIEISVHAPYYINLANTEEASAQKSFGYILSSAEKLKLLGGKRLVFHPASQGKLNRGEAVSLTEERMFALRDKIYENNLQDLYFCPETMGKLGQIGTIEEIARFCKIDKVFIPCIDFGHVNARECGSLKTKRDYIDRFNYLIDELGFEKVNNIHIHFSKIEYSAKGEVRHLTFADNKYGPDFEPFLESVKELNLSPYIICESAGTQDADALVMKKFFQKN